MSAPRCPLCPWTSRMYAPEEQPRQFAIHVADNHDLPEAIGELITRQNADPIPCHKIGYPTEEVAMKALIAAWQSTSPRRQERRAYKCGRCGYHHLTSKELRA